MVKSKEHADWEILGILQTLRKKVRFAEKVEEASKEDASDDKQEDSKTEEPKYDMNL